MKTAIFHYDYHNYGTYKPNCVNLGDYVQSLVAAQYFSKVDTTIDRDSLSSVSEELSVIGNGWYCIDKARHSLSDNLNFLPVAIHINNRSDDVADTVRTFANKNGSVGCRDIATMEFLQRNGIESYFSFCLTTTLDFSKICPLSSPEERSGIILADLDDTVDRFKVFPVNRFLSNLRRRSSSERFCRESQRILDHYDGEKIERTTHECSLSTTHEQRFSMALDLLRKYASARCVITSRIHCALLCLALGTLVLLATKAYDELRYRGLDSFLNHIFIDQEGRVSQNIETLHNEIVNSYEFRSYANSLRQRCTEFVNVVES